MKLAIELDFDTLCNNVWGSAIDRLDTIKEYNMEEALLHELELVFGGIATDEKICDYLRYEFDVYSFIAENIAFNTLSDLMELEDYADNLYFDEAQETLTKVRQQNKEEALWEYLKYGFDMRNLYEVMEELKDLDIEELE